jgi:hypothetical protein
MISQVEDLGSELCSHALMNPGLLHK